jgi:hypothetical protein
MAIWDFGSDASHYTTDPNAENLVGTPTLVISGGTLDPDGKDGIAYIDAAGVSHVKGQAAAWDEIKLSGDNAKWIVTLDTTGWQDISLRFDYKAWDPSTTSFDMDYRLSDADTWTHIENNYPITADNSYHAFSYSLASLDVIENKPLVELRFNDLDHNGKGKFAFDNFELTGSVIPEPFSILLFGLGAVALRLKRKS